MIPGIVASQVIGAFEAGGGAPSVAVLEYLGAHYDATNQTTYTFAGIDFGVAAAGRVIIVAFKLGSDDGGSPTNTVTIGGVTATEVTTATFANIVPIALFYAEVPTGTTGNVVITGANSPQNCALQVWAAYDVDPAPHNFFSAASNGSGTSMGSVVDVPEGGFLVAAWGANHADLNASWTGATEEAERVTGEQTFEAASDQQMAEEIERSVSVSHAAATHRRMVCGTWGPGEGGGGGDVTPPTLSSATGTATGETTADLSVSTDEGNGTLYWVVTQSSTGPTKAQVKLGQNHLGAAADDADDQAVSGTGVQNAGATGLTAETEYWAHFMHEDAATNQSDVATSASFETDASGAATPVYRASTVVAFAGDDAMDLPYPPDIVAGEIMVVLLSSDTPALTFNTPTDFDPIGADVDIVGFSANVFLKRAVGGESGNLTVSQSGAGGGTEVFMATMHIITGCVASGNPIEDTDVATTTGTSLTSGTVTTLGANRLICQLWAISDNMVGDAQAPYNENYEITTGAGTDGAHAFCSAEKATAGVSDVDARTIAVSNPMIVFTLALKP